MSNGDQSQGDKNRGALLPCPFCGESVQASSRADDHSPTGFMYFVVCYCGGHSFRVHQFGHSLDEVAGKWNQRAPITPSAERRGEPVAWRYRYHWGAASENKGMWKYADTEDDCNRSAYYEREPLYAAPSSERQPVVVGVDMASTPDRVVVHDGRGGNPCVLRDGCYQPGKCATAQRCCHVPAPADLPASPSSELNTAAPEAKAGLAAYATPPESSAGTAVSSTPTCDHKWDQPEGFITRRCLKCLLIEPAVSSHELTTGSALMQKIAPGPTIAEALLARIRRGIASHGAHGEDAINAFEELKRRLTLVAASAKLSSEGDPYDAGSAPGFKP